MMTDWRDRDIRLDVEMTDSSPASDPETWVDQHGDYLYRYALFRIRDPHLAEDLVQETLLAALEARNTFAGHSSERTWLVGILKHKIIDYLRQRHREPSFDTSDSADTSTEEFFTRMGMWKVKPDEWSVDPEAALNRKEFWDVFARCLSQLPARQADAFVLREIEGWDNKEISKVLNVSATNLWVMLHRARMRLRRCLEIHWFGGKTKEN